MLIKISTVVAALSLVHSATAAVDVYFQCIAVAGQTPILNAPSSVTFPTVRSLNTFAKNAVEVQAFSWGLSGAPTAGGKAGFADMSISRKVDVFSPALMLIAAKGQTLDSCVVVLNRPAGSSSSAQTFMWYIFRQVMFTSLQQGYDEESPAENLSFNYGQVETGWLPYDSAGKPQSPAFNVWSVSKNAQG